jgi:hypothetical protein
MTHIEESTIQIIPHQLSDELIHWGINEKRNINKEKMLQKNLPLAFLNGGDFGEELTLYMFPETIGSASKGGMAYDNKTVDIETKEILSAKEVKFVCLEGTKECKKCKYKAPRFQPMCIECGNNEFNLKSDSRAGISTVAHLKYKDILQEYIIFVMKYDEENEIINLEAFKFISSNEYFDKYIQNQHNGGNSQGGTCNFIPYSYDWHLSGPIMILNISINISQETPMLTTHFYDMNATAIVKVPKKIFTKTELEKYNWVNNTDVDAKELDYEIVMNSGITIRDKKLGKTRGIVSRK